MPTPGKTHKDYAPYGTTTTAVLGQLEPLSDHSSDSTFTTPSGGSSHTSADSSEHHSPSGASTNGDQEGILLSEETLAQLQRLSLERASVDEDDQAENRYEI